MTEPRSKFFQFLARGWYALALVLVLVVIVFAHLSRLDCIPMGFYHDETSIGYNAALIAQTGQDEHGFAWPVYFKAFGEYKNPIYIYATALIFRLFGISEFNLRLTSFIFYTLALLGAFLLMRIVFPQYKIIHIYLLLSFGFLPHFFTLSRISLEVISQLAFIAWTVLFVRLAFDEQAAAPRQAVYAALAGLTLGVSVYTYSTARLLSFLVLGSVWLVYFGRQRLKKLALVTALFAISLLPYLNFVITHPGVTTGRFGQISYLDNVGMPLSKKLFMFLSGWLAHWSPDFLIVHGDPTLRHSTGYGGVLFGVTAFLFLVGLVSILLNKKLFIDRFSLFLLINLLFSPLAAALTSENLPHALRTILMGFFILLLSCYGLAFILSIEKRPRQMLTACIFLALLFEIGGYQLDYFGAYPYHSIPAMQSYDFKSALKTAIRQQPDEIVFVNVPASSYADLSFFSLLVENPKAIPVRLGEPEPRPGICIIYHQWSQADLDRSTLPYEEYIPPANLSRLATLLKVTPVEPVTRVRCYE